MGRDTIKTSLKHSVDVSRRLHVQRWTERRVYSTFVVSLAQTFEHLEIGPNRFGRPCRSHRQDNEPAAKILQPETEATGAGFLIVFPPRGSKAALHTGQTRGRSTRE
jgi:hypothetical protein